MLSMMDSLQGIARYICTMRTAWVRDYSSSSAWPFASTQVHCHCAWYKLTSTLKWFQIGLDTDLRWACLPVVSDVLSWWMVASKEVAVCNLSSHVRCVMSMYLLLMCGCKRAWGDANFVEHKCDVNLCSIMLAHFVGSGIRRVCMLGVMHEFSVIVTWANYLLHNITVGSVDPSCYWWTLAEW